MHETLLPFETRIAFPLLSTTIPYTKIQITSNVCMLLPRLFFSSLLSSGLYKLRFPSKNMEIFSYVLHIDKKLHEFLWKKYKDYLLSDRKTKELYDLSDGEKVVVCERIRGIESGVVKIKYDENEDVWILKTIYSPFQFSV